MKIEKNIKKVNRKRRKIMNKYMKIAKELSEDNLKTNAGGPFGACVVKMEK